MSNNNIAWASVALINEILTLLDFSDTPNYDLGEVNGTLSKTKQILGKHLSQKLNINAYDVSLQGIKDVLVKIKMKLIDIDFAENKKKEKIQILRLDLLLSYRVGQFESLFNINDNGVAISQVSSFFESNEGRDFWIQNFGDKLMIPWNTFYKVYCSTLQTILSTEEQLTLRNFVDFTRDGFVTPYEFSLFLRWFGPLKKSITFLCETINFGIMSGFIPAFEAETILSDSIPGTYLFRLSKSNFSSFALALVSKDGKVKQTLLETNKDQSGVISFGDSSFHSLTEFAKSQAKLVYPAKYCWLGIKDDDLMEEEDDGLVDVRVDTKKEKKNSIFIPRSVGSSHSDFCIVCLVNPLQIVFLECGHVSCCKSCAGNLVYCPMCKSKIERSVQIIKKTAKSNVYGSNPVHLVL